MYRYYICIGDNLILNIEELNWIELELRFWAGIGFEFELEFDSKISNRARTVKSSIRFDSFTAIVVSGVGFLFSWE